MTAAPMVTSAVNRETRGCAAGRIALANSNCGVRLSGARNATSAMGTDAMPPKDARAAICVGGGDAGRSQLVAFHAPAIRRFAPVEAKPAHVLKAIEGRVEGALSHLERVV